MTKEEPKTGQDRPEKAELLDWLIPLAAGVVFFCILVVFAIGFFMKYH